MNGARRVEVLLTGGSGMLGQAIRRLAQASGSRWSIAAPTRKELDLTDRSAVGDYLAGQQFDIVIHAAARVGGIAANMANPVDFLVDNIEINTNVIDQARRAGVPHLLFLGSSCMYPKDHRSPLVEEDILAAPLEPTNEGYALSKIAGAKLCQYVSAQIGLAYRTLIPCNLYGPGDHFTPPHSHLVASVLHKLHEAKEQTTDTVEIWGDGSARREFLYVDDLARYILDLEPDRIGQLPAYLNLGFGKDFSVLDYYRIGASVVGYEGSFRFNLDAPTGMRRKLMSSQRAQRHGWRPTTGIEAGMAAAYEYYRTTIAASQGR